MALYAGGPSRSCHGDRHQYTVSRLDPAPKLADPAARHRFRLTAGDPVQPGSYATWARRRCRPTEAARQDAGSAETGRLAGGGRIRFDFALRHPLRGGAHAEIPLGDAAASQVQRCRSAIRPPLGRRASRAWLRRCHSRGPRLDLEWRIIRREIVMREHHPAAGPDDPKWPGRRGRGGLRSGGIGRSQHVLSFADAMERAGAAPDDLTTWLLLFGADTLGRRT